MTVAQTKAARRKFKQYYRRDNPIGTPRFKRRSVEAQMRREAEFRKRQQIFAQNKSRSKK